MVSCQFFQSRLAMVSAIGAPVVRPRRTPDTMLGAIGLDAHALAAPVATLPAPQILRDSIEIDDEAGGDTVDDGHEALAV